MLACQAVNILGVVQPDQADIRETVTTTAQLIDISKLLVNSTLQLIINNAEDPSPFTCTSNPFSDYYTLTKNVNVVDLVSKVDYLYVVLHTSP